MARKKKRPKRKRTARELRKAEAQRRNNNILKKRFPKNKPHSGNYCPLCGMLIPKGQMLNHKALVHNEKMRKRTDTLLNRLIGKPKSIWVGFVQGGTPGSGKKK